MWHLGVLVVSALMLYSAARLFNNAAYINNIAIGRSCATTAQAAPSVGPLLSAQP